jgi:hypothetical protein
VTAVDAMNEERGASSLVLELRSLISCRSDLTQAQAAEILQVSRARISQLAKQNGLHFRDGRGAYRRRLRIVPASRTAAPADSSAQDFLAAIEDADERAIASDLLRKGFIVYRAMARAPVCEFILHRDGRLLRVKVCHAGESAARLASGDVVESAQCDVLATVDADGSPAYWLGGGAEWSMPYFHGQ